MEVSPSIVGQPLNKMLFWIFGIIYDCTQSKLSRKGYNRCNVHLSQKYPTILEWLERLEGLEGLGWLGCLGWLE